MMGGSGYFVSRIMPGTRGLWPNRNRRCRKYSHGWYCGCLARFTDRRPDQRSATLLVVVLFSALLAAAGLVVDGGAKLRAAREASAVAEEATRAGAGQIDRDRAYSHGGRFIIDRTAAIDAARAYLTSSGNTGSVGVASTHKIRVTVTISKPTMLLALIGINEVHVTKTTTANLIQGINGSEQ